MEKFICPKCDREFKAFKIRKAPDRAGRLKQSLRPAFDLHVKSCGVIRTYTCSECQRDVKQTHRGMCGRCYKKWQHENMPPNRECDGCGKPIYKREDKSRSNYFCTRACWREWKKKGEQRPCEVCGKSFYATPKQIKDGMGRTCSVHCGGIIRRNNPSVTTTDPITSWRQSHGFMKLSHLMLSDSAVCCDDCNSTKRLVVHHLVSPDEARDVELLMNLENLLVLCRSCHTKRHHPKGVPAAEQAAYYAWRQSIGWKRFRDPILRAEGAECDECGQNRENVVLTLHHLKDPNPTRNERLLFDRSNNIILCRACHARKHIATT